MTDVQAYAGECFRCDTADRLGVELEFLIFDATAPSAPVPIARVLMRSRRFRAVAASRSNPVGNSNSPRRRLRRPSPSGTSRPT